MEIYVDVEVHDVEFKDISRAKFLFNTFSTGYDVYLYTTFGGRKTVFFERPAKWAVWGAHSIIVTLGEYDVSDEALWLDDREYIRSVIQYAMDKGLIPQEFAEWLSR